ncbi:MAG TPA: flagellar basal-body MS-ring/collar protein FliF [Candidatus Sumerlaeota bacterium]|nr:flagellar basal-body MS-ring/collar protein FliF [Candidatus Sumerlaeota bacterium]
MAFPNMQDLKARFLEILAQQSKTAKLLAVGGLLLVLCAGVVASMYYRKGAPHELLYAGLDTPQATQVRDELKTRGVEAQMVEKAEGWSVYVPQGNAPGERALGLRLDLAPKLEISGKNAGWELFDEKDFGSTYFTLSVKKQRALVGELVRTLKMIKIVKDAEVQLNLPPETVFAKEEQSASASVMLKLMPKAEITREQVKSVQCFIAGSVQKLKPENVFVTDDSGKDLTKQEEPVKIDPEVAELQKTQKRFDLFHKQKTDLEKELERKIVTTFEPTFGEGHVQAGVAVEYDYTKKEQTETVIDKKNLVPISEALEVTSSHPSPGKLETGIVGVTKQMAPGQTTTATTTTKGLEYVSGKIINYDVGKKEVKTVYPEYAVKRISASVFLDSPKAIAKDPKGNSILTRFQVDAQGNITSTPNVLSEQELENFNGIVKGIIGASEERGDTVAVKCFPFNMVEEVAAEGGPGAVKRFQWQDYVRPALWGIGFLFLFFGIIRPLMRVVAPRPEAVAALGGPETPSALGVDERILLEREEAAMAQLPPRHEEEHMAHLTEKSPEEAKEGLENQQLDDEILALAKDNPKKVPLVLRSWIEGTVKPV